MHIYIHLHANKKAVNFNISQEKLSYHHRLTRKLGSKSPGNFRLARISHSPSHKRDFGQGEDGIVDETVGSG